MTTTLELIKGHDDHLLGACLLSLVLAVPALYARLFERVRVPLTVAHKIGLPTGGSAIRSLNRARWDNHLLSAVLLLLGCTGAGGVYATLDGGDYTGRLPHELVARKAPRRPRRKEMYFATESGSGMKKNAPKGQLLQP